MTDTCFAGSRCMVTGAAGGLGLGLVRALLQAGAQTVWMADVSAEKLQASASALSETFPGRIVARTLDVSDQAAFSDLAAQMVSENGGIDILINNAGIGTAGFLYQMHEDQIRRLLDINLLGVIHGCKAALPYMARQGSGRLVNIGSLASFAPLPWRTLYTASKFAVLGFSRSLRQELDWMQCGVRVCTVCPSAVSTDIWQGIAPKDCITADEAAGEILQGIARGDEIIPVSDHARRLYGNLLAQDRTAMAKDEAELLQAYRPLFFTPELARSVLIRQCRDSAPAGSTETAPAHL